MWPAACTPGDPTAMQVVVDQALAANVSIGAHPGLPDITGFGRRVMALDPAEVRDLVRYQVGALVGFLDAAGASLHHIKPHGALFGMVARDASLMDALCDVAVQYQVPVYGLARTSHEQVAVRRGVPFVSEFYVDLDYTDDGIVLVNRTGVVRNIDTVTLRAEEALEQGTTVSISGKTIPVRAESFCIHSDLPNAPEVARAVRHLLESRLGSR
jgi:5-oxoprolinase (ATP-hydrolysing) subunit A